MSPLWLVACLVVAAAVCVAADESYYPKEDPDEFDFDGLPGVTHNFKIEVPARSRECFFQKVKKGAFLQLTFQVLRGGDRNVDMTLLDPANEQVAAYSSTVGEEFSQKMAIEGDYTFCFDNRPSHFTSKLVMLYLSTYVVEDWHQFGRAANEFSQSVTAVETSVEKTRQSIIVMRTQQIHALRYTTADRYVALANNNYVQNFSVFICLLTVLTGTVQVYFVRRLFEVEEQKSRGRA